MMTRMLSGCGLVVALLAAVAGGPSRPAQAAPEKVILDTDFNTIGDDGQALVMLAQGVAQGKVDLLGLTTVSGNQWRDQETADALRALERLGLSDRVGVYPGANDPLIHDLDTLAAEQQLFGKGYAGAWRKPRPGPDQILAPADGFATKGASDIDAVDFIVDTIERNPREVTILAIGPLTNLALAFRKNPEIVPLVKRIIYMGGAIDVPGNVTPAAEFNWWFDPEAARIVLREPIEHLVVPLDVTDKTRFGKDVYDRIAAAGTPVSNLFRDEYAETFKEDPAAKAEIWDTITVALLFEPDIATNTVERFIDMDTTFGANYGRSMGYAKNPPLGLQRAKIVFDIDQERFWRLYQELLTAPVPIRPAG